MGLTVLDARIITSHNGYTLDSFTVQEEAGEPIADRRRSKEIIDALREQLNQPEQRKLDSNRQTPRVLKNFETPTEISFDQDATNKRTLVEIITADRPGLLCRIGRAFMDCGIQIQNAKIATIGARAEDVFFITNHAEQPLHAGEQQAELKAALLHHLGQAD